MKAKTYKPVDNVDKSVYKSKMPKNHNKDGVDNFGGNGSGKLWKLWTDTCPNMWFVHIVKHRAKSERFSAFLSEKDT